MQKQEHQLEQDHGHNLLDEHVQEKEQDKEEEQE